MAHPNPLDGIPKNTEAGTENEAAQLNLAALYLLGSAADKNEQQAFVIYKRLAEKGNIIAVYNLGVMYLEGLGIQREEKKAFELFEQAAKQGHVDAISNLAVMYANGRGVQKDEKRAFELSKQLAEKGEVLAQSNLAMMYENGWGVEKDLEKACVWYKKAANQGCVDSQAKYLAIMNSVCRNKTNIKLIKLNLSKPKVIYRIIQSGKLSTIKFLLSIIIQEYGPLLSTGFDAGKLTKPTIRLDFQAVSFIQLEEALPEVLLGSIRQYQVALRKLGVIFTLDDLETQITQTLNMSSGNDSKHYRKQLLAVLEVILSKWRAKELQQGPAARQLNKEALKILDELLWSKNNVFLKDCKSQILADYALGTFKALKRREAMQWPNVKLELWFKLSLWKEWQLWKKNSEGSVLQGVEKPQKEMLMKHFERYLNAIIYRYIKTRALPEAVINEILKKVKASLLSLINPKNQKEKFPAPLKALFEAFRKEKQNVIKTRVPKISGLAWKAGLWTIEDIHEQAFQSLCNKWREDELSKDADLAFRLTIDSFSFDEILPDEIYKKVSMRAVAELIFDCKKWSNQTMLDEAFLDPILSCIKMMIENNPIPTEIQRQKIGMWILDEWKKSRLPAMLQTYLDQMLMQRWNDYSKRLGMKQRGNDINIKIAEAKDMIEKLQAFLSGAQLKKLQQVEPEREVDVRPEVQLTENTAPAAQATPAAPAVQPFLSQFKFEDRLEQFTQEKPDKDDSDGIIFEEEMNSDKPIDDQFIVVKSRTK